MKIKRLWVSKYKNISDIDLIFNENLIALLVGKNGLDKSNLIEILALIFPDLDLDDKFIDYESWAIENFQFYINYECINDEVIIELREQEIKRKKNVIFSIKIKSLNSEKNSPFIDIELKEFIKNKDKLLPEYLIGYYSGENKRIKDIINFHEKKEYERLVKLANRGKTDDFDNKTRRLFFTESHHSQMILLTLQLYSFKKEYKALFNKLLLEYLNIEDIPEFSIKFNNPDWNYANSGIEKINKGMDFILANIQENVPNPFWNLAGKLDRLLTRFYNYEQELGKDPTYYELVDSEKQRNYENEILEYSKIKSTNFSEELKDVFPDPLIFFDALETSNFIGIINDISFKVKKKNVSDLIEYSLLSEGEQQLLTVIGLLLLFGNSNALFLFDEPDTHLNPDWQRDFTQLLNDFTINDKKNKKDNCHIFVATHSPLIVQNSYKSDIVLFNKTRNGFEINNSINNNENWRTDHVLTSKYFGLESARPKSNKTKEYFALRDQILKKDKISSDDLNKLKKFIEGETFPSGETFKDLKAMQYILNESNHDSNK